jgi:hypothetical protein
MDNYSLRKAAEMALEALKNIRAWPETREALHQTQAIEALRQALADEAMAHVWEQKKKQWVGLSVDEVQETGRYSYCRGDISEKLYRIMWNSKPSASVGWCRDELIAFARAIEAELKEKNT